MKNWLLAVIASVVAVIGIYLLINRFNVHKEIKIFHTNRPGGYQLRTRRNLHDGLSFGLDNRLRLTEIKVVPLAEWQTNRYALPLWHLVSDSNSAPVIDFGYGQRIRGMKSAVAGAQPQPLEANTIYRLFVAAGNIKGQHDFEVR